MVTILKPREIVPVDPAPAPEARPPRTEWREWRYSMPFAGVKYFSFRPAPLPDQEPAPHPIAVKLIDERVMLI